MSHVFRKKISKKYIESIGEKSNRVKSNVLIFDDRSCRGGKEDLKKNYDKIKTYEIP
jgi:predicted alpha/beta-fold hydrolase